MDSTRSFTRSELRRGLGFPSRPNGVVCKESNVTGHRLPIKFVRSHEQLREINRVRAAKKEQRRHRGRRQGGSEFEMKCQPSLRDFLIFLLNISRRPKVHKDLPVEVELTRFWARDAIRGVAVYAYYQVNCSTGSYREKVNLQRLYHRCRNIGVARQQLTLLVKRFKFYSRYKRKLTTSIVKDSRRIEIPIGGSRLKFLMCRVPCQCFRVFFPEIYTQCDRVWSIPTPVLGSIRRYGSPVELRGDLGNLHFFLSKMNKLHLLDPPGTPQTLADGSTWSSHERLEDFLCAYWESPHIMNKIPLGMKWDYVVYHDRRYRTKFLECSVIKNIHHGLPLWSQVGSTSFRIFDDRWQINRN